MGEGECAGDGDGLLSCLGTREIHIGARELHRTPAGLLLATVISVDVTVRRLWKFVINVKLSV